MEILYQIADYGIVAAVVGFIAFLACGFGKLFFCRKLKARFRVDELKSNYDAIEDKDSNEALIALDLYSKAKNQYTMAVKKRCNLISIITGIVLLVPFYYFILGNTSFYIDVAFWTNVFAIPAIAALYYNLYQGIQSKNISIKVWLHKLVNLCIALVNYVKNLKRNKAAKDEELIDTFVEIIEEVFPIAEEKKQKIKEKMSKRQP